jgi:alkaline phosphatase D
MTACVPFLLLLLPGANPESHQATGVKVGEVTDHSAIVWMRLTARSSRRSDGVVRRGRPMPFPASLKVEDLEGSCPGAAGQVRVRYGTDNDLKGATDSGWKDVGEKTDFTHQFRLTGLKPDTEYFFSAETRGPGGKPEHGALRGRFRTAPKADVRRPVTFTVITGQAYKDVDHKDGFHIYEAMGKLQPHFLVPTGDTVYYDSEDPRAVTEGLARYHWHRMYSYPRLIQFHLHAPAYWEKDDHDTVSDDCWPTKKSAFMLPMTFAKGQRIFREQVPMGEKTYRTFRWGKGLQVWLVEGRDFRSPNTMKDGPDKTIWGAVEKKWLKESMKASDADWKVLISPTPIIGPDRTNKRDNHANAAFKHEGDEIRQWLKENVGQNVFLACGDRHWQYHSVHPGTGLHEFSCGPASDKHAGGSPGLDKEYHKFHRVKGGFLSVTVTPKEGKSGIVLRLHDVHGKVVHEYSR